MKPAISVLMPLLNGADTIMMALASLQAQTCEDWECIIVDDGSTDDSATLIHSLGDERIRYHRLDRNFGRGYARQQCLNRVNGSYVAFLDADDWIYPDKFRRQLELLESGRGIDLVSTGMAIADAEDRLTGVRNTGAEGISPAVWKGLAMPPFAFPPTMMTAKLATQTGFDPSFPTAEDVDFLVRALPQKRFSILPHPLYVYREHSSATLKKTISAFNHCCRVFEKQFDQHPLEAAVEIATVRIKQLIYYSASALGLWNHMIVRRSRVPNEKDFEQYEEARRIVGQMIQAVRATL